MADMTLRRVWVDFNNVDALHSVATLVRLADGEDPLRPDDRVIAYDGDEGLCEAVVDSVTPHGDRSVVVLTLDPDTFRFVQPGAVG